MRDIADMDRDELARRLNEACRMVVDERTHALRIADAWERCSKELDATRAKLSEAERVIWEKQRTIEALVRGEKP